MRRKNVNYPVDGLNTRIRMESSEGEMAGLGHGQRRLYRFQVSHFADEHDIRILPEDGPESRMETFCVLMHLSLIDDAGFVLMSKLNGIFDSYNVFATVGIDSVYHRGQRGRLARSGRSCHQNEAPGFGTQLVHNRGESQLLKSADLIRYEPERSREGPTLHENIGPESTKTPHSK